MVTEGGYGGSMLDKLGSMLSGGSGTDSLQRIGSGLVSSLFGDKAGGIADTIAGLAGIRSGSAGSLLSLAARLVMSVLGKQIAGGGLGATGLMNMLIGQRSAVSSALPAGLSSLIGTAKVPDLEGAPTTTVRATDRDLSGALAYRGGERRSTLHGCGPPWPSALWHSSASCT
jgi:hypothetical protein